MYKYQTLVGVMDAVNLLGAENDYRPYGLFINNQHRGDKRYLGFLSSGVEDGYTLCRCVELTDEVEQQVIDLYNEWADEDDEGKWQCSIEEQLYNVFPIEFKTTFWG